MNFEKLNRLIFTEENSDNSCVSWGVGKQPLSPCYQYENLTENEYRRIIQFKTRLDEMVYEAVLGYLNNKELCNDEENFFPQFSRLTGNYYVSDEYYWLCEDEIRISIMTHFTEMFCCEVITTPSEMDYLGLDVHFSIKNNDEIEILGIDSSSI